MFALRQANGVPVVELVRLRQWERKDRSRRLRGSLSLLDWHLLTAPYRM